MTDSVYGKYSTGSGLDNEDENVKNIFSSSSILQYTKEISNNLYRMGIDINSLAGLDVLNIGTGREAIALSHLGAKSVSHYDYSKENVERLKSYIEKSKTTSIKSCQADIVDYPLKQAQFDLIYTHGVIQHFSHTGVGLLNLLNSLKKNGIMWLFFYRSGSLGQFIHSMARDVGLKKDDLGDYYVAASLIDSQDGTPNHFVSGFMDSVFCEYSNLFTASKYIDFVGQCGLKIIGSSKLDLLNSSVDHKYSHPSTILMVQGDKVIDLHENVDPDILSPTQSVDQLDKELYLGQAHSLEVIEILQEYEELKDILAKSNCDIVKFSFVYRLEKLYIEAHSEYCKSGFYDLEKIYPLIRKIIKNTGAVIDN
jgi:SAM-dependent methyltransferase